MVNRKRIEKNRQADTNQKKATVAIFISDEAEFRTKNITRDKEEHYTMTKGSVHQDMIILNVYIPNGRATKYNNQKVKELKEEIDNPAIIVRDFNSPLCQFRTSRQKNLSKQ